MRIVHARGSKENPIYRLWSTVVDAYLTGGMSKEGMITYLVKREGASWNSATLAVDRAQQNGTSVGDPIPDDAYPFWDAERAE